MAKSARRVEKGTFPIKGKNIPDLKAGQDQEIDQERGQRISQRIGQRIDPRILKKAQLIIQGPNRLLIPKTKNMIE